MLKMQWRMLPQFLLLLVFGWISAPMALNLIGTEFGSGFLTGILVWANIFGMLVLLISSLLALFLPRKFSLIVYVAASLCLPLYIYLTVPGIFQRVAPGPYSTPASTIFTWNADAVVGMLFLIALSYLHLRRPGRESRTRFG
jgi:hypothetical protein